MNFELEKKYKETVADISETFGETLDLNTIVFLIGVQELNQGYKKFTKDQKLEVMHIGICSILEPYGHYNYLGRDKDDWPQFELIEELPPLNGKEQEDLLKQAIVDYFDRDVADTGEEVKMN